MPRERERRPATTRDYASTLGRNLLRKNHETRRQGDAQHLARTRRLVGRNHRPDGPAASAGDGAAHYGRRSRAGDPRHAGARRAADRRDRRLRHLSGAAAGPLRRIARTRLCGSDLDAADRDQSGMGARRDGGRGPQPDPRAAFCRRLPARRRNLQRGCRRQRSDRPQRAAAHRSHRRAQEIGRAGERAHPLQCRLARRGRCRHRDGADLSRPRQGCCRSCLRRRDAAAQPGRIAHRLGGSASTACRTP